MALDVEDLQHGAPGDEGVDVPVLHDDAADAELAEVGEGGAFEARRARELPEAKVEAGEGGHPEERVGEEHLPRGAAVDEDDRDDHGARRWSRSARAGWHGGRLGRRRCRGTAVTGGTAAPGDDDETQREITRRNEKSI